MKMEASPDNVPTPAIPQPDIACGALDERTIDGDFPIEGDGGTVDASRQAHLPPPPPAY